MAKTGLGFRVRSGWAAAVVLAGPSSSPRILQVRRIELSDPGLPESRQPFHAVDDTQGDLEPDEARIEKRVQLVQRAATKSIGQFLEDCRTNGWEPHRAGIVAGSLTDPSRIHSPHIRAHAMEGHLFRTAVVDALRAQGLSCLVLAEGTAFDAASRSINRDVRALKRTLANFGRGLEGPWRADEKLAALAAWAAISETNSAR